MEGKGRLNSEQKENLIRTFSMEDAERALKEMRTKTTPGPNGFPVDSYTKLCGGGGDQVVGHADARGFLL
jgi:hypothetical protein